MNAQLSRLKNDIVALRFVHAFGWLRIAELGALVKPHTNTSMEAGARLARSLAERQLVLLRKLPDGAGHALVLAQAGVRVLAENGINAVTGKDLGKTLNGTWIPSVTWRHDILAHAVLSDLRRRGYGVIPEAMIRRQVRTATKLPDGFVKAPGAESVWLMLEVENARKTGPHMKKLADAVVSVAQGEYELIGIRPVGCLIAYWLGSRDERGHQLNHRHRISTAIASTALQDVPLTFLECTRRGAVGVASIDAVSVTIQATKVKNVLDQLNANGWHLVEESSYRSQCGVNRAYAWQHSDEDNAWSYSAEGVGWIGPAGYADSLNEAKRMAAGLILRKSIG